MPKLIYVTNMSLDGYIEDEHGAFNLYTHDDDVFIAQTGIIRSIATLLYGRRLYETMAVWETDAGLAGQSDLTADFAAAWAAADKVVYSTTLTAAATARTRIERRFEPAAVRDLKTGATGDLAVGGAEVAGQAMRAGLVDECHLFIWPWIIGGGKPALPGGMRTEWELLDLRRFGNGVVYATYGLPT